MDIMLLKDLVLRFKKKQHKTKLKMHSALDKAMVNMFKFMILEVNKLLEQQMLTPLFSQTAESINNVKQFISKELMMAMDHSEEDKLDSEDEDENCVNNENGTKVNYDLLSLSSVSESRVPSSFQVQPTASIVNGSNGIHRQSIQTFSNDEIINQHLSNNNSPYNSDHEVNEGNNAFEEFQFEEDDILQGIRIKQEDQNSDCTCNECECQLHQCQSTLLTVGISLVNDNIHSNKQSHITNQTINNIQELRDNCSIEHNDVSLSSLQNTKNNNDIRLRDSSGRFLKTSSNLKKPNKKGGRSRRPRYVSTLINQDKNVSSQINELSNMFINDVMLSTTNTSLRVQSIQSSLNQNDESIILRRSSRLRPLKDSSSDSLVAGARKRKLSTPIRSIQSNLYTIGELKEQSLQYQIVKDQFATQSKEFISNIDLNTSQMSSNINKGGKRSTEPVVTNDSSVALTEQWAIANNARNRIKTLSIRCLGYRCSLQFEDEAQMIKHLKNDHLVMPYKCLVSGCDEAFENK